MEFPVNEVQPRFPWFLKLLDWIFFFFLLLPIAVKILVYLALLQILLLDPWNICFVNFIFLFSPKDNEPVFWSSS